MIEPVEKSPNSAWHHRRRSSYFRCTSRPRAPLVRRLKSRIAGDAKVGMILRCENVPAMIQSLPSTPSNANRHLHSGLDPHMSLGRSVASGGMGRPKRSRSKKRAARKPILFGEQTLRIVAGEGI
jgi:hypothetical protein